MSIAYPTAATAPGGAAGGDLAGEYPNPTVGLLKVTIGKLAEAVQRLLLGSVVPSAPVEHTAATYEITPSATKNSLVAVRCVSKTATTCKYNIKIGGVLWTEIVDPSITGSIDITVPCYVPAGFLLLVEKV